MTTKKYLVIAIALASAVPSFAFASFNTSLSYGSSGTAVTQLQQFLVSQNCLSAKPTGYFGALTTAAVKCFQTKYHIVSSGYFGVQSRTEANLIAGSSSCPSGWTCSQGAQSYQSSVNLSQGALAPAGLSPLIGSGSSTILVNPATTSSYELSPLVGGGVVPPASTSLSQGVNATPPLSPLVGGSSVNQ